ncbi:MAG: hypothetical protein K0S74_413 [Chlamydiales bacterium]|jgi:hypothetical protein|nr:hypothetical protein [Chlamydiales bacterium]
MLTPLTGLSNPNDCPQLKNENESSYWAQLKRSVTWIKKPEGIINAVRGYNALVATSVLASYIFATGDVSAKEYLFDVAVHVSQAYLAANASENQKIIVGGINVARITAIMGHCILQDSTIPSALNFTDIINHGINLLALITVYDQVDGLTKKKS